MKRMISKIFAGGSHARSRTIAQTMLRFGSSFLAAGLLICPAPSNGQSTSGACDLNQDSAVNVLDVSSAVNMVLGNQPCTANINGAGVCTVVTVQRVVNAALGSECVTDQAASGLVAAYSFDEGTGTTVGDASGNGISGTIVGASWNSSGKFGNALSFNGSTSYVDFGNPSALQLTGSMTLSAWIYAAANPADDGQIIAKSDTNAGWQLKTSPDTGNRTFGIAISADGSSHIQRYSNTRPSLNTWYHVAGVYNATARTLDIYVNGVLDNGVLSGTVPSAQYSQSLNANSGRRSGGYYFNGTIDEIRIYNRALSPAEIVSEMTTPIGNPGPPDTTQPTVSMTAPASGATVSGTTTVSANATDNVSVAAVQFLIDGANLGSEVTSSNSSYTISWNSSTVANGQHTLSARARDLAGNTAVSSSRTITVSNSAPVSHNVVLSWNASTTSNVTYNVYRSSTSGGTYAKLNSSAIGGLTYTDSTVQSGQTYYYVARAVDGSGTESTNSNQATAVIPTP